MRCWLVFLFILLIPLAVACGSDGGPAPDIMITETLAVPNPLPTAAVTPTAAAATNVSGATATLLPTFDPARLTAIPTPAPVEGPVLGIELSSITGENLELAQQAGAYWIRRNALDWAAVEPNEGARNWSALADLEAELQRAASAHLPVILVVRNTPAWASGRPQASCYPVKPEKLPAFAGFLHDAAARYGVDPYNVQYWELGNEPDIDPRMIAPDSPFGCWGLSGDPTYGGASYAEMLKAAYPQIKSANPAAKVLVGGLLLDCDPRNPPQGKDCSPSRYLEGILQAGGGDYFDGVSFHAYDYYQGPDRYGNSNWGSSWDTTGPVVTAKTRYLRQILSAHGRPEKFLINTEAGLLCGSDGTEPPCQEPAFQRTKAVYAALVNAASVGQGLTGSIWYSLKGWRGTALVDKNQNPLPAYKAFQVSADQLRGARFVQEVDQYPGLGGYEFLRDGRRMQILVAIDGQEHTIRLPESPLRVLDYLGKEIDAAAELTVGAVPLYIEWDV